MASSSFALVFLFLFCVVSWCVAKTSPRPLLQVTKDAKTLEYITQISQRTPLVPVKPTLDLGGGYMWVNCEDGYISSSYRPALCGSAPCRLLNTTECTTFTWCQPPVPGCYENTCKHMVYTPIANMADIGDIGGDVFKTQSTNGMKLLTVPSLYFLCGRNRINEGLASGVTGMVGLGRTRASLPAQLSSYFRFDHNFALCLSSSNGTVFFGNVDASSLSSLTYTPLIVN